MEKNKFKVQLFTWESNVLHKVEHLFEDLNKAIRFCENSLADVAKVFDHEHNIHHSCKPHRNRDHDRDEHHGYA